MRGQRGPRETEGDHEDNRDDGPGGARRINRILASLRTAREQLGELDATVNTDDFKYFSARLNEIIGNDEEGLTYLATLYGKR